MIADPLNITTEDGYLRREKVAETKSAFLGGRIVAMAGASPTHVRISMSFIRLLGNQLAGKPCEPFGQDMRVKVGGLSTLLRSDYTYPDVFGRL